MQFLFYSHQSQVRRGPSNESGLVTGLVRMIVNALVDDCIAEIAVGAEGELRRMEQSDDGLQQVDLDGWRKRIKEFQSDGRTAFCSTIEGLTQLLKVLHLTATEVSSRANFTSISMPLHEYLEAVYRVAVEGVDRTTPFTKNGSAAQMVPIIIHYLTPLVSDPSIPGSRKAVIAAIESQMKVEGIQRLLWRKGRGKYPTWNHFVFFTLDQPSSRAPSWRPFQNRLDETAARLAESLVVSDPMAVWTINDVSLSELPLLLNRHTIPSDIQSGSSTGFHALCTKWLEETFSPNTKDTHFLALLGAFLVINMTPKYRIAVSDVSKKGKELREQIQWDVWEDVSGKTDIPSLFSFSIVFFCAHLDRTSPLHSNAGDIAKWRRAAGG